MAKLGKKNQKRVAKLVAAALMCAGGGFFSPPSVASAEEVTVTNVTANGPLAYAVTSDPADGMNVPPGSSLNTIVFFPKTANVLNITGTFDATTSVLGGIKFYGGYNEGASGKTVNITGTGTDIAVGTIAGGFATNGYPVTGNHVNFLGGTTNVQYIYGGNGPDVSKVSDNHVTIAAGSTVKYGDGNYGVVIIGGHGRGDSDVNTVTISGTLTSADKSVEKSLIVIGGETYGDRKNATGNSVTISGATLNTGAIDKLEIIGGSANNFVDGITGDIITFSGNATDNTVTISGASTFGEGIWKIFGGFSDSGAANDNTVEISGGTINGTIYGGQGSTEASGNTVTISGGTVKAGNSGIVGGESISGAANNNTVTISGGTINSAAIWGGHTTGNGSADGNIVTISGGTFEDTNIAIHGAAGNGDMTNNTVNILTKITVGSLIGGESYNGGASSGNTLNLAATGVTANNLYGFQNMNFFLPTDMKTTDTMLTVNSAVDVTDAKVGVMAQGKLENLTTNNKVTLLSSETLEGGDTITQAQTTEIVVPTGLTTSDKYEFKVANEGNTIVATITKDDSGSGGGGDDPTPSPSPDDPTNDIKKSPVEVRAATVTMLNAGADMLASQGFTQAANAVAVEAAEQAQNGSAERTNGTVGAPVVRSFTPFAAFGGSSMRAESGSHVDTKGFGINVGFAKEFTNSQGKLLFGPVVEYGGGKYDSYNNDVHGDGSSHYWGFGLMARQTNNDGFYYEGSVRYGRVTSDYSANLPTSVHASYDSASNYWAAHLGLGKIFATGKQDTVDAYLKYFYSHQGGDDTDITLSAIGGTNTQHASFDSIDSNRIRIGARYTHKINEMNSLYGGLAYQYEFGGEARAHYAGLGEAPSPSVKGSSGMLELGWQVKPGGPVTIDLGVTGWAGKQRGGSVQLGATWTF